MKSFFKTLVLLSITGYAQGMMPALETHYKLSVHVTQDPQHTTPAEWHQCSQLVSALAQHCHETARDTSAQAFNNSQIDAIQTIKKVYELRKAQHALRIDIDTTPAQVSLPKEGLFIAFEYFVSHTTPQENKSKISALMQQLQE